VSSGDGCHCMPLHHLRARTLASLVQLWRQSYSVACWYGGRLIGVSNSWYSRKRAACMAFYKRKDWAATTGHRKREAGASGLEGTVKTWIPSLKHPRCISRAARPAELHSSQHDSERHLQRSYGDIFLLRRRRFVPSATLGHSAGRVEGNWR